MWQVATTLAAAQDRDTLQGNEGMAERLVVDHTILAGSADALERIKGELDKADQHREEVHGVLGSGTLAEAMKEFTGNWDRHRGELVKELGTMVGTLRSASETFRTADHDLGKALDVDASQQPTSQQPGPQGGPR
jgi:hypothetical protein